MSSKKVIRIEMEYEDGEISRAVGEDASEIWKQIEGMIVMESIHGRPYTGPKMVPVAKPEALHADNKKT